MTCQCSQTHHHRQTRWSRWNNPTDRWSCYASRQTTSIIVWKQRDDRKSLDWCARRGGDWIVDVFRWWHFLDDLVCYFLLFFAIEHENKDKWRIGTRLVVFFLLSSRKCNFSITPDTRKHTTSWWKRKPLSSSSVYLTVEELLGTRLAHLFMLKNTGHFLLPFTLLPMLLFFY